MKRNHLSLALAALAVILTASPCRGGILAASAWDNPADGVDGWSFTNDGTNFQRLGAGGNPGGFLQVTDLASGPTIYFAAPAKFLGHKLFAYNYNLTFDLQQSATNSQFSESDILLVGNGITLAYQLPATPAQTPDWSSFSVQLLASAGWKVNDINGAAASEAQMVSVLANLTSLSIRAEFQNGIDTDGIDNVILNGSVDSTSPVPEPSAVALVAVGVAAMLLRRLRTQPHI